MMEEDFLTLEVNSFLYNAGIVGLHYLLRHMDAREGADYRVEGGTLSVAKSFLLERDLTRAYMTAHIEKFQADAAFNRLMAETEMIGVLTKRYQEEESKETKKALNDKYQYLLKNSGFVRASYISAMAGLDEAIDLAQACKKIKDIGGVQEKWQALQELRDTLQQPKYREALLMKDIIYSRINAIWSNKAFLNMANAKKKMNEVYEKDFVAPLKAYLHADKVPGKKAKFCIECDAPLTEATEISFLNDSVDDMTRKKSSFWNYKPDAFLCPFCAFVYSLAPLGFAPLGQNLIFVNCNTSVGNLVAINDSFGSVHHFSGGEKENEKYQHILDRIVQEIIAGKLKEQSNIQVVVRDKLASRYKFSVIAKDTLDVLASSLRRLEKLQSIAVEVSPKNWFSVYQGVVENIFKRANQYGILQMLLRHSLKENTGTLYLTHVLDIQLWMRALKKEEANGMEQTKDEIYAAAKKDADNAFYRGRALREVICGERGGREDADNKLRGFVYQLLNALQVGDREKFWYLVLKMYSGLSLPVPKIFLVTFSSREELQYLGYAFILGLKNEKYIADDKNGEAAK